MSSSSTLRCTCEGEPRLRHDDDCPIQSPVCRNCPIKEVTGDNIAVGRCYFYLPDGKTCPRHGDVGEAVVEFEKTGRLTREVLK